MNIRTVEGGCLCGSVRYRITGPLQASARCYCRSCQLASAAPSVAWAVFPANEFAFVSGKPARYHSSPGVVRTFCGKCGTPLTYQSTSWPDAIDVTTATLDDAGEFGPTKEIWVAEKLAWDRLDDALAQYPGSSVS